MKKLFLMILACIFLSSIYGCKSASSSSSSAAVYWPESAENQESDTTDDTPAQTTSSPISMSLLTANDVYLYDDEEFVAQESEDPKACGDQCFTDGDIKVFYDDYGVMAATESMDIDPDHVLDDWSIVDVSPDVAYAQGALYKWYSAVYFQGDEQGSWYNNKWKTGRIIKTLSGEYIAIDDTKNYHPLSTALVGINYAGDLLVHNFDAANKTATVETASQSVTVTWEYNYFNGAKDWLELDGTWYSWNGYEFTTVLEEEANALWGWNVGDYPIVLPYGQYPTIISAGVYGDKLYWIECNKGIVFDYNPATDEITPRFGLYSGDGYKTTGLAMRDTLKPEIVDNTLHVTLEGAVQGINLDSGIVSLVFAAEGGEVTAW